MLWAILYRLIADLKIRSAEPIPINCGELQLALIPGGERSDSAQRGDRLLNQLVCLKIVRSTITNPTAAQTEAMIITCKITQVIQLQRAG